LRQTGKSNPKTAKLYFSRWKIEEYFRCKKQMFQFENFRVRKLKAIHALNFYLTLCMASLAYFRMRKKASGSGFGQSALYTVNSALSWLFE
jgi:transposase